MTIRSPAPFVCGLFVVSVCASWPPAVGAQDAETPRLGVLAVVGMDAQRRVAVRRMTVRTRSMIRLSVAGAPPGEDEPSVGLRLATINGTAVVPVESSQRPDEPPSATFVLRPNTYDLSVQVTDSQPRPVLDALRSANLVVHIDEIVEQELPATLSALESWLTDIGLGGLTEAAELFDFRDRRRGLPGADRRLAETVAVLVRGRTPEGASAEETRARASQIAGVGRALAASEEPAWPPGLPEARGGRYFIPLVRTFSSQPGGPARAGPPGSVGG